MRRKLTRVPTVIAMSAERGEIELPLQDFFTGYRQTTLPADAVIVKVIVPLNESSDREVVRAYKQVSPTAPSRVRSSF